MAAPLILLTGATGFVGRQVLRALTDRGCRVRAVVVARQQIAASPVIDSVIASPDIFAENAAWWIDACRGVDTVIHVAWYAEPGVLQSPGNCRDAQIVFPARSTSRLAPSQAEGPPLRRHWHRLRIRSRGPAA